MTTDWLAHAQQARTGEERRACLASFRPGYLHGEERGHPFDFAIAALAPELRSFVYRVEEGVSKDVSGRFDDDDYVRSLSPETALRDALQTLRLEYLRFAFGMGAHPEWDHTSVPGSGIARATSGLFSKGADASPRSLSSDERLTLIHQLHFAINCEPMGRADRPLIQRMRFSLLWAPDKWVDVIARGAPIEDHVDAWLEELLAPIDQAAAEIVRVAELLNQPWSTPKNLVAAQAHILNLLGRSAETTEAMRLLSTQETRNKAREPRSYAHYHEPKPRSEKDIARAQARATDHIRKRAKPALRFSLAQRPTAFQDAVQHSEFGGAPGLRADDEWPFFAYDDKRYPMRFWAQINLRELPQLKSPLPSSGWLLFFSNLAPIDGRVPTSVIFYDEGLAAPRSAPDSLLRFISPGDLYSSDPRRFMANDHPLARLEFRRRAYAVPVETYPDSEDGSGARGWTVGSDYEAAFRELEYAAEERADRLIANVIGAGSREGAQAPRLTKLQTYLTGGPYTWADIVAACDTIEATIQRLGGTAEPDLDAAGEIQTMLATLTRDAMEHVRNWREHASSHDAFTKLDDARAQAVSVFSDLLRRADIGARARRDMSEVRRLNATKEPSPAYLSASVQSARDFRGLDEIVSFNIKRAAHEGYRVEDLYPDWLVDAYAPTLDVRRKTYSERAERAIGSVHHGVSHQVLGWGASIQSAPARHSDKVLLLQIGGGDLAALPESSTALQFWISEKDLKARRFDQAFATIESN
jgi:uncharacterized protein YwqG